jgi:hypothetical protein
MKMIREAVTRGVTLTLKSINKKIETGDPLGGHKPIAEEFLA